jgi:hypothetical protein
LIHISFGIDSWGLLFPSRGWIWTIGINGIKKWNDKFYGQISTITIPWLVFAEKGAEDTFYIGTTFFTGITIVKDEYNDKVFFLGNSFRTSLDIKHP